MRFTVLLLIAALLFCGCPQPPGGNGQTGDNGQPSQARAQEYRFPLPDDPLSLDPAQITDTVSDSVSRRIYNTLVKFDQYGQIHPDIAEWHSISEDGLEYKFKLREDVRFHDGAQVTADDVIYSYTRLVDPSVASPRTNLMDYVLGAGAFRSGESTAVEGLVKVDEFTVKLILDRPYSPFIYVLCMTNFGVVPRAAVERDPDGFGDHPVGTGPFVFDSWQKDDRVILKANRDYFGTPPHIETLTFRIIKDEKTRFENFKSGALEHCDIPPSQIKEVRNDPELNQLIMGEPAMDMYCYGFNCEQPPFKDNALLRQAFNHAVDKQNIIDNIWGGLVSRQKTFVPEGMMYFWSESEGYPYNPDLAAELLDRAGYPEGEGLPELVLNIDLQPTNKLVAQAVQEDLRRIGVNVRLEVTAWGPFLQKVYDGEALFFQNTWLGDYPDPDTWLYQLLHSDNFGEAGNITRWANSEFDHLVNQAQIETDPTRRGELYNMAEKIAFEEAPWLMLFWKNSATLVQPYVKGLKINRMDRTPQLNNAPIEEVYFED